MMAILLACFLVLCTLPSTLFAEKEVDLSGLPAFERSVESDGVTITVRAEEGVFPEGASLSVRKVTGSEKESAFDAVSELLDEDTGVMESHSFDIKVVDANGEELQPRDGQNVEISFRTAAASDESLDPVVYHLHETDGANFHAEELSSSVDEANGVVSVETDGFSLFVIEFTYTRGSVKYTAEYEYPYNQTVQGESKTFYLSELFEQLGVRRDVSEVTGVNGGSIFQITKEGDDYKIVVSDNISPDTDEPTALLIVNFDNSTMIGIRLREYIDQTRSAFMAEVNEDAKDKCKILVNGREETGYSEFCDVGSKYSLEAVPASGWIFVKWVNEYDPDGGEIFESKTLFTVPEDGLKLTAYFENVCGDGHAEPVETREDEEAATCISPGSYVSVLTCPRCGEELSRNTVEIPLDPDAHDWRPWEVTKSPTATRDGEEQRVCKLDSSHVEKQFIPMIRYKLELVSIEPDPNDKWGDRLRFTSQLSYKDGGIPEDFSGLKVYYILEQGQVATATVSVDETGLATASIRGKMMSPGGNATANLRVTLEGTSTSTSKRLKLVYPEITIGSIQPADYGESNGSITFDVDQEQPVWFYRDGEDESQAVKVDGTSVNDLPEGDYHLFTKPVWDDAASTFYYRREKEIHIDSIKHTKVYEVLQEADGSWKMPEDSQLLDEPVYAPREIENYVPVSYSTVFSSTGQGTQQIPSDGMITVTENGDLFIYYARKAYELVYYEDIAGTKVFDTVQVPFGAKLSNYKINGPTKADHTFAGWSLTPKTTGSYHYKESLPEDQQDDPEDKYTYAVYDFSGVMPAETMKLYPVLIPDRLEVHLDLGSYDQEAVDRGYTWYNAALYGEASYRNTPATMGEGSDGKIQSRQFMVNINEKLRMEAMNRASRDGYVLKGWYTNDGVKWEDTMGVTPTYCDKATDGTPIKIPHPELNYNSYVVTLKADWTPMEISVQYDPGAYGAAFVSEKKAALGRMITLADAPVSDKHHRFIGWEDSKGTLHSAKEDFTLNDWTLTTTVNDGKILAFTAKYEEIPLEDHSVIFDSTGGSPIASIVAKEGAVIQKPADPVRTGFEFDGWYVNSDSDTAGYRKVVFPMTMPDNDVTLVAFWNRESYTISFDTAGGSKVAPVQALYEEVLSGKVPADPVKEHFLFTGWNPAFPGKMPAENLTLQAVWTPAEYTITYDANGGSWKDHFGAEETKRTVKAIYDAVISQPEDPVQEDSVFLGWALKGASTTEPVILPDHMPDTDPVYVALWHHHTPGDKCRENIVQATCETDGRVEEAVYCTECGEELSRVTRVVPAYGHLWEDWQVIFAPTCSSAGMEERVCRNDASHVERREIAIDPDEHDWGPWTVVKEATELEEGTEERVCQDDPAHKETRTIPTKDHEHKLTKVSAKNATCIDDGNIEYWICDRGENPCNRCFDDVSADPEDEINKEDTILHKTGHSWNEWVRTKAPTCMAEGEEERTCRNDPAHMEARTVDIDPNAHDFTDWTETRTPTCTSKGEEERVCLNNANHKETRTLAINEQAHNWGPWTEITAPTCSAAGAEERVCSYNDGHREVKDIPIASDSHDWGDWTLQKAPTCSAEGEEIRVCKNDPAHVETRTVAVDPNAHDFGKWEVTKPATETEEGLETRYCSHDPGHTDTRIIPKKSHVHKLTAIPAKAATCIEDGHIEYWICDQGENPCGLYFRDADGKIQIDKEDTVLTATDHDWGDWTVTKQATCSEKGEETRVCRLDASHKETRQTDPDTNAHDWGQWKVTRAATETEEGEETRTCRHDEKHTETRVLPKKDHVHQLKHVYSKLATCEEDGNIEYWICDQGENPCRRYFRDKYGNLAIDKEDTVIRAIGHSYGEWMLKKAPTCAEMGEEIRVCSADPSHTESRPVAIDPNAHAWGDWIVTKEATELEEGEETRTCRNDPAHTQTAVIPKKGHVHQLTRVEAKEATCTMDGNVEYWICDKGENPCGGYFTDAGGKNKVDKKDVVIPASGHDFGDWTVTTKATCASGGEETRICRNDPSHVEKRLIAVDDTAHRWGQWVVVKEATETEEGEENRTCLNDPSHIDSRVIPKKGHVHQLTKVQAKTATCLEDGNIEYYICNHGENACGRYFTDALGENEINQEEIRIPAKGHNFGDWIVTGTATCSVPGEETRTCLNDPSHTEKRQTAINKDAHDWGEWIVTKEATESEEGVETRTCKNDPSHKETRTVPKKGHVHRMTRIPAKTASCTENGNIEYWICDQGENPCGRYFTDAIGTTEIDRADTVIPAAGHDFGDWTRTKPASCSGAGEEVRICKNDSDHIEKRMIPIDVNAHNWGPWVVTKEATETAEGEEMRTCGNDAAHTETRSIPMKNHVHQLTKVDAKAATCLTPGNTEYYICDHGEKPCGKYFKDALGKTETEQEDIVIPATGHDFGDWTLMKEATCAGGGEESRICKHDPSHKETRLIPINSSAHRWGSWSVTKQATETEEGREVRSCLNDPSHIEERSVPKKDHVHRLTKVEAKDATCLDKGNIGYWICDQGENPCGRYFADDAAAKELNAEDLVIPATGHSYGEWAVSKTASCTEPGEEKRICENDATHIETRVTAVDPKAHKWGEWTVTKEATETEEGEETRTCKNDPTHTETRKIPTKDHEHGLVKVDAKDAGCETEGNIEYWICSEGENPCGRYFADEDAAKELNAEDLVTPATGHSYGEWTSSKTASCTEQGEEKRVCEKDATHVETRVTAIDPEAHAWDEWTVTKEATETEEGEETRTCKNDPAHTETRKIPIKEHVHGLVKADAKDAGCETEGNIEYWICSEGENPCGRYFADEAADTELNAEDLVTPATGHSYGEWTLSKIASCTEPGEEKRICEKDATHVETRVTAVDPEAHEWGEWTVTKEATETEEGEETRTCKNDPTHTETRAVPKVKPDDTKPEEKEDTEEAVTYDCVEGSGSTYTVGSDTELEFRFERSSDDDNTFEHFTGVEADGKVLNKKYFSSKAGSVIISLKPDYLNTLAPGSHFLKALFDDGESELVVFTVTAPDSQDQNDQNSGQKNSGGSSSRSSSAQTGDDSPILLWILLLAGSLLGIIAVVVIRRRRNKKRDDM